MTLRAARADIVAGKQLLNVILEVSSLFSGHFHAAAAQHRGVHGGVQHMQDSLMNNDLHGYKTSFRTKSFFAYSIAQHDAKGETVSCKQQAGMLL